MSNDGREATSASTRLFFALGVAGLAYLPLFLLLNALMIPWQEWSALRELIPVLNAVFLVFGLAVVPGIPLVGVVRLRRGKPLAVVPLVAGAARLAAVVTLAVIALAVVVLLIMLSQGPLVFMPKG